MTPSHAFIFDLDGTLVDSLQDITDALNHALGELGQPVATPDQVRQWIGDGLPMLCRRASSQADEDRLEKLVHLVENRYRHHCTDHTRPYPKVLQMLSLLKQRRAPMAVLSNKPQPFAEQVVDALGLTNYFAEVRGYSDEREKKPAPTAALRIARRLGTEPKNVFFVGDSAVDIATARNAGMIAVAATWGFRSVVELKAAEPDFLVADPKKIPMLPA